MDELLASAIGRGATEGPSTLLPIKADDIFRQPLPAEFVQPKPGPLMLTMKEDEDAVDI